MTANSTEARNETIPNAVENRMPEPGAAARIGAIVSMLFFDLGAPLGLYYGLRGVGVHVLLALVAGAVPPLARYVYLFAKYRRIDALGVFIVSVILLSTVVSFITGDPRLLLAKEAWMTAIAGVWILGTLVTKHPFIYRIAVPFMPGAMIARLEHLWATSPKTRRVLRVMTWVWGIGFLIDSVARVVVAYSLDLDTVPVVNTILIVVLVCVLQGYSQLHGKLSGFFDELKRPGQVKERAA